MRKVVIIVSLCCFSIVIADSISVPTLAEKIAIAKRLADEAAQGKAAVGRVIENNFDFASELKKFRELNRPQKQEESIVEDSDITIAEGESSEEKSKKIDAKNILDSETSQVVEKKIEPKKIEKELKEKYVVDTSKDFVNGYYIGVIGDDSAKREERKKEILDNIERAKKVSSEKYFSFNNRLFSLTSDEYNAHSTMIYIVGEFEKLFDLFFSSDDENLSFSKKIWLKVSNEKEGENVAKKTVLSISKSGDFSLYVAWSKNLKIEDFCKAMSEALLMKVAYESGGEAAARKVPQWLKSAFAKAMEQSIRYGVVVDFAQVAADNPPPMPISVFSTQSVSELSAIHAYWTLVAIEKVGKDKAMLSSFMRSACRGDSPESLVKRLDVFNTRKIDFTLWWRCLITGEIWARVGGVLSAERSVEEIARLAVLSVESPDGGRMGVSGSKIWENRELYAKEIKLRIIEIKVTLSNINPLYHNVLVSLGEMFEGAENNDESDFNEAKSNFMHDFQVAKNLSNETKKMMCN